MGRLFEILTALFTLFLLFQCKSTEKEEPIDWSEINQTPGPFQTDTGVRVIGERLFKQNCANCHLPHKVMAAPALAGIYKRWSEAGLYNYISDYVRNPDSLRKSKNPYIKNLLESNKQFTLMPSSELSDREIKAILDYCQQYLSAVP